MLKTMERKNAGIDIKSFRRNSYIDDDVSFERKTNTIFQSLHLRFLTEIFLTKKSYAELDIYDQIKKYDSMWITATGIIVAFWDHKTKLLHY